MKVIVIDDEPWMLRHFHDECADLEGIELVGSFRNPLAALGYAQDHPVDLAFIDMEMPQLNGAETAKMLVEIQPGILVVIVSAYDEGYIATMLEGSAYRYLRKPYKKDDLRAVISRSMA